MINEKLYKEFLSLGFLNYMLFEKQAPEKINYVQVLEIEPSFKNLSLQKDIRLSPLSYELAGPKPAENNFNYHSESEKMLENQTFASETIALIYERQGALSQAISIYKRLIEIEPEKSDYYIKRINDLEKSLNS